jgi:hypothetical protein
MDRPRSSCAFLDRITPTPAARFDASWLPAA